MPFPPTPYSPPPSSRPANGLRLVAKKMTSGRSRGGGFAPKGEREEIRFTER